MENKIVNIQGVDALFADMDNRTPARQVFGRFLYEGELGILFGDSNAGKSILANDIAFFAGGGGTEWGDFVSPHMPSLYIDMEMTAVQFAERYRDARQYIPAGYRRATVDTLAGGDMVFASVKSAIIRQQGAENPPKLIIIDNITNGFGSIYSPTKMRSLVSELKTIKDRFGLTILLIAHCPKRKAHKPVTDNDLGGSKMLLNFCDSAFAIATSRRISDVRYVKQIKTRNGRKLDDVMTVRLVSKPYLSMKYESMDEENLHLLDYPCLDYLGLTPEQEIQLAIMIDENKLGFTKMAELTGTTYDAVRSYADHLRCVEMKEKGNE